MDDTTIPRPCGVALGQRIRRGDVRYFTWASRTCRNCFVAATAAVLQRGHGVERSVWADEFGMAFDQYLGWCNYGYSVRVLQRLRHWLHGHLRRYEHHTTAASHGDLGDFDQDIGGWDTSAASTSMYAMFAMKPRPSTRNLGWCVDDGFPWT